MCGPRGRVRDGGRGRAEPADAAVIRSGFPGSRAGGGSRQPSAKSCREYRSLRHDDYWRPPGGERLRRVTLVSNSPGYRLVRAKSSAPGKMTKNDSLSMASNRASGRAGIQSADANFASDQRGKLDHGPMADGELLCGLPAKERCNLGAGGLGTTARRETRGTLSAPPRPESGMGMHGRRISC